MCNGSSESIKLPLFKIKSINLFISDFASSKDKCSIFFIKKEAEAILKAQPSPRKDMSLILSCSILTKISSLSPQEGFFPI